MGDRTWGTHFCNFYESRKDLLDMLLSYFKAGLEDNEFCVWVLSEPLSERVAWDGLPEGDLNFITICRSEASKYSMAKTGT